MGGDGGSSSSATRSALADAAAGVAGSLTSMLAFYPVDVYKTNLQAGKKRRDDGGGEISGDNDNGKAANNNKTRQLSTAAYAVQILTGSFRGVRYKTAHTVASSFAYFFIYSWITSRHRLLITSGQGGDGSREPYRPSTTARLLLAAVAAMMNTTLTLPLDVLSARKQTGADESNNEMCGQEEVETSEADDDIDRESISSERIPQSMQDIMDQAWDEAEMEEDSCSREGNLVRIQSDVTGTTYETANEEEYNEEKKDDVEGDANTTRNLSSQPNTSISATSLKLTPRPQRQKMEKHSFGSLWSGLMPSLLLCTNPSIHYTVFDILKSSLLQRKATRRRGSEATSGGGEQRLSMAEAFVIGLMAKFAATIATYPLIRAKVILMCNEKDTPTPMKLESSQIGEPDNSDDARYRFRRGDTVLNFGGRVGPNGSPGNSIESDHRGSDFVNNQTLMGVLRDIYHNEGVFGLYRGCNLQLIHTVLKSALLMMVREKISVTTRRLLLSEND